MNEEEYGISPVMKVLDDLEFLMILHEYYIQCIYEIWSTPVELLNDEECSDVE